MLTLAAEASHKMQKYLKILNFRLDVVVNDICGLIEWQSLPTSAKAISILKNYQTTDTAIAENRKRNCQSLKRKQQEDYLFGLKQELESYQFYQKKIAECDKQIAAFLKQQINTDPEKKNSKPQINSQKNQ